MLLVNYFIVFFIIAKVCRVIYWNIFSLLTLLRFIVFQFNSLHLFRRALPRFKRNANSFL